MPTGTLYDLDMHVVSQYDKDESITPSTTASTLLHDFAFGRILGYFDRTYSSRCATFVFVYNATTFHSYGSGAR